MGTPTPDGTGLDTNLTPGSSGAGQTVLDELQQLNSDMATQIKLISEALVKANKTADDLNSWAQVAMRLTDLGALIVSKLPPPQQGTPKPHGKRLDLLLSGLPVVLNSQNPEQAILNLLTGIL